MPDQKTNWARKILSKGNFDYAAKLINEFNTLREDLKVISGQAHTTEGIPFNDPSIQEEFQLLYSN